MNTTMHSQKKVAVIGAGLGGMSAAISLAAAGFHVEIFEKNAQVGGKLNLLEKDGFSFDLGPSIFTLPQVFQQLFERAGKRFDDYVTLQPVTPHWRNFFEDGTTVDLDPERKQMSQELAKLGANLDEPFDNFLEYSRKQYELVEAGYFQHGLDNMPQLLKFYGKNLFKLDFLTTMHRAVNKRLPNPYLRDIFDFFIKYVGSSALRAPGFMNLMPHIQFGFGLWYVDGGMYNLARGMKRLLDEMGVNIHLNCEVRRIVRSQNRVTGIETVNGETKTADWIVSNMEVIPAYTQLLDEPPAFLKKLKKFEPACSGIVIHLGTDKKYECLAHHNFFYSKNQRKHFNSVFRSHELPDDPTIYVVAPTRTDPTAAPENCDNIKILPHIPYINEKHQYSTEDYLALKDKVLDKLERMGLADLRRHIVTEDFWTPYDIRDMYYSNGGSIYGVISDIWKNYAFKAPKQSEKYENLLFVGGSVNPGGGMPMTTLSGQLAADLIIAGH